MRAVLALIVLGSACGSPAPQPLAPLAPPTAPAPGLAIALYAPPVDGHRSFATVDDRRWIDVPADRILTVDRIDPEAPLESLTIASITPGDRFALGVCTSAAPGSVRCAVDAAPGRRLIRIHYDAPGLTYIAAHTIAVGPDDRATITSTFAIKTLPWHMRAELTLYDRRPGEAKLPTVIGARAVELDGDFKTIAAVTRTARARLRWVFKDAETVPAVPVSVWLVVDGIELAPGTTTVHLARSGQPDRDFVVLDADRETLTAPHAQLRLPLWDDPAITVAHTRTTDFDNDPDGDRQAEHDTFSITSTDTVARELWIEQRLRAGRRHTIKQAWPRPVIVRDDRVYSHVTIAPGAPQRLGYTIVYD